MKAIKFILSFLISVLIQAPSFIVFVFGNIKGFILAMAVSSWFMFYFVSISAGIAFEKWFESKLKDE